MIRKLLSIEENVSKEIDQIVEERSKTKYTSWSSLVRELIRLGLSQTKKPAQASPDKMKGSKK